MRKLLETRNLIVYGLIDNSASDAKDVLECGYAVALAILKAIDAAKETNFFDSYNWDQLF